MRSLLPRTDLPKFLRRTVLLFTLCALLFSTAAWFPIPVSALDLAGAMSADTYTNADIGDISLPYRLYVPENISADQTYGLLVYFHDEDCCGDDNVSQISNADKCGLINDFLNDETCNQNFLILVPQCPTGKTWTDVAYNASSYTVADSTQSVLSKLVMDLINTKLKTDYALDSNRMFLGGISMGATMCYDWMARYPGTFSAAFTVTGICDPTQSEAYAKTQIFAFSSDNDTVTPPDSLKKLTDAMQDSAGFHATQYVGLGHEIWTNAFSEAEPVNLFLNLNRPAAETEPVTEVTTAPQTEEITEAPETEPVTAAPAETTAPAPSLPTIGGIEITPNLIAYVIIGIACLAALILLILGLIKNNGKE